MLEQHRTFVLRREHLVLITDEQGRICIGTHDGTFHCDEVLAISMLRLLPDYEDALIVRTRDLTKLGSCDILVDVGAEYDAERLRFDHHQRGFTDTMEGYATKLSSSGLVYKHFGVRVIREIVGPGFSDAVVQKIYKKAYVDFMEHIDGIDNGVSVTSDIPMYKIETHLPARVGRLNPSWNEDDSPEALNARFSRALELVSTEFVDFVMPLAESWWPARQLVETAFGQREGTHSSGQVMVLTQYCPWIAHLFDIEEEEGVLGMVKYVLYQDQKGQWRIHAVPEKVGSFASRLGLPERWRGLRDAALCDVSGIPGCTFVHANGFIGGNVTLEGAIHMADCSLKDVEANPTN
jgi:uncharacterized UPF0160 family protein